jgi:hypothetical protein
MKILYLDICCLNHPYDDFSQIRVLLESEAVLEIMRLCEENNWIFPSSEIIDLELSKITNNEKLLKIMHLYEKTNDHLTITDKTIELSRLYRTQGIGFYDSMHSKGMEALNEALGTVGTIYFLRQFSGGSGNWTEERKSILADVTEADFENDLAALRKNPLMQHKGSDYTEWRRKLLDISPENVQDAQKGVIEGETL